MGGPIRVFFAVEVKDKKLIHGIGRLQEKLSGIVERLKLVELENIHITLRFLGDISEETAKRLFYFLEEEINPVFFKEGGIEFTVQKLSDFSKRVYHLGLQGPVSVLREIHSKIDDELVKSYGFEKDRNLKSHITIARARKSKTNHSTVEFPISAYIALKTEYGIENVLGSFKVTKVYLKKSILTPQGPIYTNLEF